MIVLRIADGVRSHFVARLPEWGLATELGVFGWQLLRTGDGFATSHIYGLMASIATGATWGSIAVLLSATWLVALILNGTFSWFRRVSPWVRSLSAMASAIFWGVAAVKMALVNDASGYAAANAGYAMIALSLSLITAREVGTADKDAINAAACKR